MSTASENTARENVRDSLSGWRQIAGMDLLSAMAIDLMFVAGGAYLSISSTGYLSIAGVFVVGIGLIGIADKVYRRVR